MSKINIEWEKVAKAIEVTTLLVKQRFPNLTVTETIKFSNEIVRAIVREFEGE